MKKLFFALLASVAVSASAAQYVTVTVCDGGESGTQCHKVTYKVRPPSAPVPYECTVPVGEAGYAPCPTHYGVPHWMKSMNQWFLDHGFTAPEHPEDELSPGGGN